MPYSLCTFSIELIQELVDASSFSSFGSSSSPSLPWAPCHTQRCKWYTGNNLANNHAQGLHYFQQVNIVEGLETFTLALFTRVLGHGFLGDVVVDQAIHNSISTPNSTLSTAKSMSE